MKTKSRKLPKAIRPEEFKKLISVIPKKDVYPRVAFLLAYGAGMRISEVVKCEEQHFSPTSIFIPESKYGLERVVPIPKGWRKDFFKNLPINKTHRALQYKFNKYKKAANINPLLTFHSLRHGFATRALESGVPINQVQVLIGHSNLSTTSIYTKANPADALKNYEELF